MTTKMEWVVSGWQSTNQLFEQRYPLSAFSEKQMAVMLQRYVAKGLTYDEIAGLSRKRQKGEGFGEFAVSIDGYAENIEGAYRFSMSVGSNPYFTADVKVKTS
jgi:hypothetical protein